MSITSIRAHQILDSRGTPTIRVDITLNDGTTGYACVPSGASTGKYEACELRDGNIEHYAGNTVYKAVGHVNEVIAHNLCGMSVARQTHLDHLMCFIDGTANKEKLGANAILGVSLALARTGAKYFRVPLYRYLGGLSAGRMPRPLVNVINGGRHAKNGLDVQEFMLIPTVEGGRFSDYLKMVTETFYQLKKLLSMRGMSTNVGDEGGFAPDLSHSEQALNLLMEAIKGAGYRPGKDLSIALDVAASELRKPRDDTFVYTLDQQEMDSHQLIDYYGQLLDKYPIISIEDPLDQDDYQGWQEMTARFGPRLQIVGDDLFVTNRERLQRGIDGKWANAILIKVNQIGTLTETLQTIDLATRAGFQVIVSHRSGETCDTFISDLAVAVNCGQIKAGSVSRGERVAKYNRLLQIEAQLGNKSVPRL